MNPERHDTNGRVRIAVTGGPGGGESTATQLLRRELGERVIVVPESAPLLFSGGFPRHATALAQAAVQRAFFHVQRNLEDVQAAQYPDRLLLCDRGTLDGVAYWPDGVTPGFFETLGTTSEWDNSDISQTICTLPSASPSCSPSPPDYHHGIRHTLAICCDV